MENIPSIESHQTAVNLHGLMQVLSKHLYSTPIVALRELVQNAHDAIIRRRVECPNIIFQPEIRVEADPFKGIITVSDNGAGLTEQEIHDFLATVGIGYTRHLRQLGDENGLIGMFGLGFLSAFVLAENVKVHTTSWKTPEEAWQYRSSDGETYHLDSATERAIGFTVTLELKPDFIYLADNRLLEKLLTRYCVLLREPLYIGEATEAINQLAPPWREDNATNISLHPSLIQKKNIEFAKQFESAFTPLCTLPVRSAGHSDAVGILWLQDGATYGTSDNRNLSLFLRGMLLDDQARDLLPLWAGFVGGVIESTSLTPTANREDLQRDDAYEATRLALSEALITGLGELAKQHPVIWRRVLRRHNEALLGAALCDERLFDLLKDDLLVPTSLGDIAIRQLRQNNKVLVTSGEDNSFEEMLCRLTGKPIAYGHRYAVLPFLRRWAHLYSAELIEIGTSGGNRALFSYHETSEAEREWWQAHLADDEQCVMSRFEPAALPFMVIPNREVELKNKLETDDAERRMTTAALMLARQFTQTIAPEAEQQLFINFNNPAIKALSTAWQQSHSVEDACQLLKSVKTLLSLQQQRSDEKHFNRALTDLNHLIMTYFISQPRN